MYIGKGDYSVYSFTLSNGNLFVVFHSPASTRKRINPIRPVEILVIFDIGRQDNLAWQEEGGYNLVGHVPSCRMVGFGRVLTQCEGAGKDTVLL